MVTKKELHRAVEKTIETFPFPGYMSPVMEKVLWPVVKQASFFCKDFKEKKLLDIGSGPMSVTAVFKHLGYDCYAADDLSDPWHLEKDHTEKIKDFAEASHIHFHHQAHGDYSIPFAENSFDIVSSFAVIEHLHESPRDLLNAMGRFARPDGLLLVVIPNSVSLRKRLSVLRGRTNYPPIKGFYHSSGTWRGHVREYTLNEVVYICRENGFKIRNAFHMESAAYHKAKGMVLNAYLLAGNLIHSLRGSCVVFCQKPENWSPAKYDPETYRTAIGTAAPQGV